MARTVYSAARREGKDVDTDRGDIHGDLHGYCCYQVYSYVVIQHWSDYLQCCRTMSMVV
ncbi:hypothetical protein KPSA1_03818 [Pseudomonas syringae pv. actinidiae]|uniref:Uncharacterized protein n=1 Tax=Pseudomonas syringae pv. actinidiae TaxID=103796 RepID=A0A2V0QBX4_PSESF|nr:hypothetical protein KPSA1_03818 [Pseudomonas syringae pv. actinidiae]